MILYPKVEHYRQKILTMIAVIPKKLKTGGSVLLAQKGPKYFSNLSKKGWKKRKAAMALYEKIQAEKSAKSV